MLSIFSNQIPQLAAHATIIIQPNIEWQ